MLFSMHWNQFQLNMLGLTRPRPSTIMFGSRSGNGGGTSRGPIYAHTSPPRSTHG